MPINSTYVSVDENYNFPPQVVEALSSSPELKRRTRKTAVIQTTALEASSIWSNKVELGVGYRLLSVQTTHPARIRIYATEAHRDADVSRLIGVDPVGMHGLIFEYVSTSEVLGGPLSPFVDGANLEEVPDSFIAISIQNLATTTQTLEVTFIYIETE